MFLYVQSVHEWCQFTSAPTQVNNLVLTSPAVKKLNSSSEPFAKGTFLAGESGSQEHRRHSPQLSLKPTAAPPGPSPSQAWRTGRQICFPYLVLRPCWDETLNPTSSSVPPLEWSTPPATPSACRLPADNCSVTGVRSAFISLCD